MYVQHPAELFAVDELMCFNLRNVGTILVVSARVLADCAAAESR